jgi:hypothetical protein
MKLDKNNKITTAAGRKVAPIPKDSTPFIPVQSAISLTKAAKLVNKVKTFLKPFVQKYRSVTVVAIGLLAAAIGKLLGVF